MRRNKKGATLIELVSYLVLLGILLFSLASIEGVARHSIRFQLMQLRLNEETENISQTFREDVQASIRSQAKISQEGKQIELLQPQQKIVYKLNEKGELTRILSGKDSKKAQETMVSKRIMEHQFTSLSNGLLQLNFKVKVAFKNDKFGHRIGSYSIKFMPRLSN